MSLNSFTACTWTLYNFGFEWQSSVCIERQSAGQLSRLASNYLRLHQITHRSITPMRRDVTSAVTVSKCFLSVGFGRFCRKKTRFSVRFRFSR